MDDSARRPGRPRWAAVCALLLGLFLMHGSPFSAGGCPSGSMTAMSPLSHAATAAADPEQMTMPPGMGGSSHAVSKAAVPTGTDGALCVSTESPRGVAVPAVLLLALLVGFGCTRPETVRLMRRNGDLRRKPPPGGRELLLRVCIART